MRTLGWLIIGVMVLVVLTVLRSSGPVALTGPVAPLTPGQWQRIALQPFLGGHEASFAELDLDQENTLVLYKSGAYLYLGDLLKNQTPVREAYRSGKKVILRVETPGSYLRYYGFYQPNWCWWDGQDQLEPATLPDCG